MEEIKHFTTLVQSFKNENSSKQEEILSLKEIVDS